MFYKIRAGNLIRYASLALPLAFAGLPIYMLAPDFYAVHHQLSLPTIGLGLLVLRMMDAFLDPLLGRIIDKFPDRAHQVGMLSAGLLCGGFFMLFSPPNLVNEYLMGWFFVSVFLVTLAFSALTILYGSVGALWSKDAECQTLITTCREAFTLVGLILSISAPFVLLEYFPPAQAYLILVAMFVGLLVVLYFRYAPVQKAVLWARRTSFLDKNIFVEIAPKTTIWFLYVTYALSAIASAVPGVLVIFFVRDYLGSQAFVAVALVLYFLAGALSMPFWLKLANRVGKIKAWQFSMMLAIFSFTWVCLLEPGDYWAYAIICLTSGAALGAEMALPPAILSEYVRNERHQSAALKYSGLTMISKLSLALAAGVCLPLLGYFGFKPGAENLSQPLFVLVLMYGALPGILKLIALGAAQVWIGKERSNYADIETYSSSGSLRGV